MVEEPRASNAALNAEPALGTAVASPAVPAAAPAPAASPAPAPAAPPAPATAPAPAAAAAPTLPHPLALPRFRNLWLRSTVSLAGDQCFLVALPWLVLQLTGSSLALGTIMMTAAIPRAALLLLGGAVTDRMSPRRILITTALARALLVGAVAALLWLNRVEMWQLYVLTLAFGIADAFSFPAGAALIPSLVAPPQLPAANSLFQSSTVLTQMAGPAPAGLIIRRWGILPALVFDALSFLAVIAALFGIADPPPPPPVPAGAPARPSMLRAIHEGLAAVHRDPPLRSLMIVFAAINLCVAGPIGIGLATLAKTRFGSAAVFGTLLSCFSGGMLAGIVVGGRVKSPRRRGLQLIAASLLAAFELIAIGLVLRPVAIGALLALMGLGIGFVNVQFTTWIQLRVERALLGRVSSVLMFFAVGLVPLSYVAAGVLAKVSLEILFVGAGAVLAAGAALALASKAARDID
jgi:MFS family permease